MKKHYSKIQKERIAELEKLVTKLGNIIEKEHDGEPITFEDHSFKLSFIASRRLVRDIENIFWNGSASIDSSKTSMCDGIISKITQP